MPRDIKPGRPTTHPYSETEKAQAVRLVRQLRAELGGDHGTVKRVAEQLGFGVESVRKWVAQTDIDEGLSPGMTWAEVARVKELEQENRELRRANAILKSACRLSSRRSSTAHTVMVGYIDRHRGDFGVEPICDVLQVAPSTYYAARRRPPSARAVRDAVMGQVLVALWVANRKVYGADNLWRAARRAETLSPPY